MRLPLPHCSNQKSAFHFAGIAKQLLKVKRAFILKLDTGTMPGPSSLKTLHAMQPPGVRVGTQRTQRHTPRKPA